MVYANIFNFQLSWIVLRFIKQNARNATSQIRSFMIDLLFVRIWQSKQQHSATTKQNHSMLKKSEEWNYLWGEIGAKNSVSFEQRLNKCHDSQRIL